jgi:hypothetical protein
VNRTVSLRPPCTCPVTASQTSSTDSASNIELFGVVSAGRGVARVRVVPLVRIKQADWKPRQAAPAHGACKREIGGGGSGGSDSGGPGGVDQRLQRAN